MSGKVELCVFRSFSFEKGPFIPVGAFRRRRRVFVVRLHTDLSALVDRGRRSVVQTLMQPLMVVELKVAVDARSCF